MDDNKQTEDENKKEREEQSKFRKLAIEGLKNDEKSLRTAKDARFKANQEAIKTSGLLSSGNSLSKKVTENLLDISENANKMGMKDMEMQKKRLKILQKTLDEVKDPVEKQKTQDLLDLTRQNVNQSADLPAKIGDAVGKYSVAASAIFAGILSDSPILAMGVAFMGQGIKDGLEKRRERKDQMADQTAQLRESIEEAGDDDDLIERINTGMSEEDKREAAVEHEQTQDLMERQAESLEGIEKALGDMDGDDDSPGLLAGIGLAAGSLALGLAGMVTGWLVALKAGFMGFIKKTLPRLLLRLNPVTMIVGTLMTGIDDAWNEYMESGSISKALSAGLGGVIDFFTFGLISKETIENLLNPAFDYLKEKLSMPFETLKDMWESVTGFFNNINTEISDTLDFNPKEIFMEAYQTMVDKFVGMFEWIAGIPDMMMESIKGIGGELANSASNFFSDMNPFSDDAPEPAAITVDPNVTVEAPNVADVMLEAIPTVRQEPILKTLIKEQQEARRVAETTDPDEVTGREAKEGSVYVNAPSANTSVSNKTIVNNLNAANSRRITTH